MTDYIKLSDEIREAWLEYKDQYSGVGDPSVVSFIAGWNAHDEFFKKFITKNLIKVNNTLGLIINKYEY